MMKDSQRITTVEIATEQDVVLARQRARQIAASVGFDLQEQTRIATAVSEIARNAFEYARGGRVEFELRQDGRPALVIHVEDMGPGIRDLDAVLDGRYKSRTGMGLGLIGARRLMEDFEIHSTPGRGTSVMLAKTLPRDKGTELNMARIAAELSKQPPQNPIVGEVHQQNQELLQTLDTLHERQAELAQLNRELEDTNRGVVALYAELDDRAEYLRKASEIKTRFFSNISHELRTPLNSIVSLSSILLDRIDGELGSEQEKQVSYIKRAAEELIDLVSDLLDLAKVEAGKITVRPQAFEVQTVFSTLRGAIKPILGVKPIELIFDDASSVPPLFTDDTKVAQILRNFLSNAIKFTDSGEVRVTAHTEAESLVFMVSDTGIGIPAEEQGHVFDEWTQVENPAQRRVHGSGLGLPLSRKLAELLGGKIWLESQVGEGSKFFLSIPMNYRGPSEAVLIEDVKSAGRSLLPVLVVEDNFETLYSYEKFLQGSEFEVVPARNVEEARRKLREFIPVAILLDVLLEGESSWTLLEEIRKDPRTQYVPVIVATVVDNRVRAYSLGADVFVIKPVERAWLLQRLRNLVRYKNSRRLLVIDDDELSRYSMMTMLGDHQFSFVEAKDGREGLEFARLIRPDAIILDLIMPEMNGIEVLEHLKGDSITASIPVLVSTSKPLTNEEEAFLEVHAAGVLPKGKSREEVIRAVDLAFKIQPQSTQSL
jgi:signal transduction histidine kinase/CheY-like chemotaxis protein